MQTFIKKITILIIFLLFFAPSVSFAAEIFFGTEKNVFSQEEEFLVQVFLNTEGVTVNALEGKVIFPSDLLELKEIRDGNSSINFWIEKPHTTKGGEIVFSGITTGGFSKEKMFLFSILLKSKKAGDGMVSFSQIQVLENDGIGTKISTKETPFNFSISTNSLGGKSDVSMPEDRVPPEDFNPVVGSDPALFDGRYFVVFSTVDKGSGIDHYEVSEGFWGEYVVAESPYLLKNQLLNKNLYVKAFDKFGNERVVRINAQNRSLWLEVILILGILLIVCIFFLRKKWRKFLKR